MYKVSSVNSYNRTALKNVMDKIYNENPEYWPHGLDINTHDGGVYLVMEKQSNYPVGFVGWQERRKDVDKKVGYYTIGILPEYRGQGFAKEAVSKLIAEKSSGVDEVRAYIVDTNTPSRKLAESLNVSVELKKSGSALIQSGLTNLGNRLTNARDMLSKQQQAAQKAYQEQMKTHEKTLQDQQKMIANSQGAAERMKNNFSGIKNTFYGEMSASPSSNIQLGNKGPLFNNPFSERFQLGTSAISGPPRQQ